MSLSISIRLWGGLDVAYVLWRAVRDILESRTPFFGSLSESLSAAAEFGQISIWILTATGAIVTLSMVFSGPLMLMLKREGVYISLIQFPFRLIFLIPPTFFFIQSAKAYFPGLLLVGVIFVLEIVKVTTEILWLKAQRQARIG